MPNEKHEADFIARFGAAPDDMMCPTLFNKWNHNRVGYLSGRDVGAKELAKANARADSYDEKFQRQCDVSDKETSRALFAEIDLAASQLQNEQLRGLIYQAALDYAMVLKENYDLYCALGGSIEGCEQALALPDDRSALDTALEKARSDEREAGYRAVEAERLFETESESDKSYNLAITHAGNAIRALPKEPT